MVKCSKCPVREECGAEEEHVKSGAVLCPLSQLIKDWRNRMLRRYLGWNIQKSRWEKAGKTG
ncbi:hypothetical protein CW702_02925 [Candidatus Bathyarchaeota archaeon]|nr:MAG: hypothetical protein CW702_02925 [Candidatus Bathyarchaeota archaeon]